MIMTIKIIKIMKITIKINNLKKIIFNRIMSIKINKMSNKII
jgi:hypothetical protein